MLGNAALNRGVAAGVVAVIGRNDHVFDRLRRQLLDVVDQCLSLGLIPLSIRDQNAIAGDHDHADRVNDLAILIGSMRAFEFINIRRQFFPTWKITAGFQSTRSDVPVADVCFS